MTLIGFATYGDHAEFITDTMSYTKRAELLGRTFKHVTLPHLSAAVLCQGDQLFGIQAKSAAMQASSWCATFDDLVAEMPDILREVWAKVIDEAPGEVGERNDCTVFMLGWSDDAQEFVAHMFASEQEFKAIRVSRPYLTPCTYEHRPSGMEMRRLWAADWGYDAEHRAALDAWTRKPPLQAPQSADAWVELAKASRLHRSLSGTWARVIVAGDLFHTRISRDEIHTRKVHEFDDTGEEFHHMVAWTQHPIALAGECWCENGKTFGECHGDPRQEQPCECGSGAKTGDCCSQVTA